MQRIEWCLLTRWVLTDLQLVLAVPIIQYLSLAIKVHLFYQPLLLTNC